MKNSDLISIVVPIYNVEKYLNKCLNSIVNQTYRNLEIILVDDGSSDNCGKICDNFAKKDKRIKVIHKVNGGLSDARNSGINIAAGKYIGFVDSDDYIEPQMYEKMHKEIIDSQSDICVCGIYINYENGTVINRVNKKSSKKIMGRIESLKQLNAFGEFDMSACDKLYKKELFKEIRYPIGKTCEDFYTTYKLFDKCNKVVYIPEALYHYYQRSNSISRGKTITNAFIEGSLDQLEYFKKHHKDIVYIAETSYAFANIDTYNRYVKNEIKCPKDVTRTFQSAVRSNLKSILKNDILKPVKKIQAIVFSINISLYTSIFKKAKTKI